jgi:protein-tyrosine phosphatase
MPHLSSSTGRWLALDGLANARDAGGLRLEGGGVVPPGRLLRADNLQDLTARDIGLLVDGLGLTAVIDLRTGVEVELEGPGPLNGAPGVAIAHHSLYPESGGHTDLDAETVSPWSGHATHTEDESETPVVQAYLGYLRRRPDSIVAALRMIARPPGGGAALVHCAAGKDRTGVVVALALEVAGVAREEIIEDYLATRERIEGIVARLASSPTYAAEIRSDYPDSHAPVEGTMDRVLELLDSRHGGAAAWLELHGLTRGELAELRARLR